MTRKFRKGRDIMATMLNGWDVDQVKEAVDGVREDPDSGRLMWRSRVTWDGGFGLDVRTEEIEQGDQKLARRFTMRGDHPVELLGDNTGPTAIEMLLGALGACVAGTFAAQATERGLEIRELEVDVEGAIDLNGFFGLKPEDPGVSDVEVSLRVQSDADPAALDEVLKAARDHSPVFDSLSRPIRIRSSITGT
jgi:uncharacterized OsmC-like protein